MHLDDMSNPVGVRSRKVALAVFTLLFVFFFIGLKKPYVTKNEITERIQESSLTTAVFRARGTSWSRIQMRLLPIGEAAEDPLPRASVTPDTRMK